MPLPRRIPFRMWPAQARYPGHMDEEITPDLVRRQVAEVLEDVLAQAKLSCGDIFVLGCSSSEIAGARIGRGSSVEIGAAVVETVLPRLREAGLFLAVQGCEHINRALVVEREVIRRYGLSEVTVVPSLHAGGGTALAAYCSLSEPTMVAHVTAAAGLDLGETAIGMHLRHVAVPVRPLRRWVGHARVTALGSRPPLVGGERAVYDLPSALATLQP